MDDLKQLKENLSILDYGSEVYGFTVERKRAKYYGFKEFDSLMVNPYKNCFYKNSDYVAGEKSSAHGNSAGSIIDFIMFFDRCDRKEAIKKLKQYAENRGYVTSDICERYKNKIDEKVEFVPPVPKGDNRHAFGYLCNERKIEASVFNSLVKRKYLFEEYVEAVSKKNGRKYSYTSVTFPGYIDGKMVFAQRCKTTRKKVNVRKLDVEGSSYEECYYVPNGSNSLFVTEAPIDTLSIMSLMALKGLRFNKYDHLGTTGTNKIVSVYNILNKNPHITKLYLAFDNDEAGVKAFNNVTKHLSDAGWRGVIKNITPHIEGIKDMNDVLKCYKGVYKPEYKNQVVSYVERLRQVIK